MTKPGFPIRSTRSHVDTEDDHGVVFSRDCPELRDPDPSGQRVHGLVVRV
jgi:hypothetical protein